MKLWGALVFVMLISAASADSIDSTQTGKVANPYPLGWEMFCQHHVEWCSRLHQTTPPRQAADSIDALATGEGAALRPLGWDMFCREHRDWCFGLPQTVPLPADKTLMALLARVNVAVNRAIIYRPDRGVVFPVKDGPTKTVTVQKWEIGPQFGDCDDYAVTKLARLIEAGLPRSALRLAVYRLPSGVYHAVLTVETDAATLVLSNLSDVVMPWRDVPGADWQILERVSPWGQAGLWELR